MPPALDPSLYIGLPLIARPPHVGEEEVEEALDSYRHPFIEFRPVTERTTARAGDVVVAEIEGRVGSQPIERGVVTLDLGNLDAGAIPGLGARLRGLPVGAPPQELAFRIPEGPAAGREVRLTIVVLELRERQLPPWDDELARDTGEAATLAELRDKIRQTLLAKDKENVERELFAQVIEQLLLRCPPPGNGNGPARESHAASLLDQIAAREGLQPTEDDIDGRTFKLAAQALRSARQTRMHLEKSGEIEGLRTSLRREKTLAWLLGHAQLVDAA